MEYITAFCLSCHNGMIECFFRVCLRKGDDACALCEFLGKTGAERVLTSGIDINQESLLTIRAKPLVYQGEKRKKEEEYKHCRTFQAALEVKEHIKKTAHVGLLSSLLLFRCFAIAWLCFFIQPCFLAWSMCARQPPERKRAA